LNFGAKVQNKSGLAADMAQFEYIIVPFGQSPAACGRTK
jgi:hypothetical protein